MKNPKTRKILIGKIVISIILGWIWWFIAIWIFTVTFLLSVPHQAPNILRNLFQYILLLPILPVLLDGNSPHGRVWFNSILVITLIWSPLIVFIAIELLAKLIRRFAKN